MTLGWWWILGACSKDEVRVWMLEWCCLCRHWIRITTTWWFNTSWNLRSLLQFIRYLNLVTIGPGHFILLNGCLAHHMFHFTIHILLLGRFSLGLWSLIFHGKLFLRFFWKKRAFHRQLNVLRRKFRTASARKRVFVLRYLCNFPSVTENFVATRCLFNEARSWFSSNVNWIFNFTFLINNGEEQGLTFYTLRLNAHTSIVFPNSKYVLDVWWLFAKFLMNMASLSDDIYPHVLVKTGQFLLALRLRIVSRKKGARLNVIHSQVLQRTIVWVIFYGLLLHVVEWSVVERRSSRVRRLWSLCQSTVSCVLFICNLVVVHLVKWGLLLLSADAAVLVIAASNNRHSRGLAVWSFEKYDGKRFF